MKPIFKSVELTLYSCNYHSAWQILGNTGVIIMLYVSNNITPCQPHKTLNKCSIKGIWLNRKLYLECVQVKVAKSTECCNEYRVSPSGFIWRHTMQCKMVVMHMLFWCIRGCQYLQVSTKAGAVGHRHKHVPLI